MGRDLKFSPQKLNSECRHDRLFRDFLKTVLRGFLGYSNSYFYYINSVVHIDLKHDRRFRDFLKTVFKRISGVFLLLFYFKSIYVHRNLYDKSKNAPEILLKLFQESL